MDYAEAVNRLVDEVSGVCAKAEGWGLSNKEVAEELRRLATEIENEK